MQAKKRKKYTMKAMLLLKNWMNLTLSTTIPFLLLSLSIMTFCLLAFCHLFHCTMHSSMLNLCECDFIADSDFAAAWCPRNVVFIVVYATEFGRGQFFFSVKFSNDWISFDGKKKKKNRINPLSGNTFERGKGFPFFFLSVTTNWEQSFSVATHCLLLVMMFECSC